MSGDHKIPDSWQRVEHGMGGVWIERNVPNDSGNNVRAELLDVIHVPAWDLHYETDAGTFPTDLAIQMAVSMFAYGVGKGLALGKEQERAAIRATICTALGLAETVAHRG